MNSSVVICPVSLNVEGPVGTGVRYSRKLVNAEMSPEVIFGVVVDGRWFADDYNLGLMTTAYQHLNRTLRAL